MDIQVSGVAACGKVGQRDGGFAGGTPPEGASVGAHGKRRVFVYEKWKYPMAKR